MMRRRIGKKGVDNGMIVGLVGALVVLGISLFFFRAMTRGVDYLPDQVCKFANTIESSSGAVRVFEGIGGMKNFLCKKRYRVIDVGDFCGPIGKFSKCNCGVFDKNWERECKSDLGRLKTNPELKLKWERRWAANQVMELVKRTWIKGLKGGETIDSFDSFTFRIKGFSDSDITQCELWGYSCEASCSSSQTRMDEPVGSQQETQYSCNTQTNPNSGKVCCAQKSPPYSLEQTVPRFCASTDLVCLEGAEIEDVGWRELRYVRRLVAVSGNDLGTINLKVSYNPVIKAQEIGPDNYEIRIPLRFEVQIPERLITDPTIRPVTSFSMFEDSNNLFLVIPDIFSANIEVNLPSHALGEVIIDNNPPTSQQSFSILPRSCSLGVCIGSVQTTLVRTVSGISGFSSSDSVVVVASLKEERAPNVVTTPTGCTPSFSCYKWSDSSSDNEPQSGELEPTATSLLSVGEGCVLPYSDKDGNSQLRKVGVCQPAIFSCDLSGGSWIQNAVHAQGEVCDSLDNDCDGGADETDQPLYLDEDGDGFGGSRTTSDICVGERDLRYKNVGGDCDDSSRTISVVNPDGSTYSITSAQVHPPQPGVAQPELCNNVDDDCDGNVDGISATCGCGGVQVCTGGTWSFCSGGGNNICGTCSDVTIGRTGEVFSGGFGDYCTTNDPGECSVGRIADACSGSNIVDCVPILRPGQQREEEHCNDADKTRDFDCDGVPISSDSDCVNTFEPIFRAVADFFEDCANAQLPAGKEECRCNYNEWAQGTTRLRLSQELRGWEQLLAPIRDPLNPRISVIKINSKETTPRQIGNPVINVASLRFEAFELEGNPLVVTPSLLNPTFPIAVRDIPSGSGYFTIFETNPRQFPQDGVQLYSLTHAPNVFGLVDLAKHPMGGAWLIFDNQHPRIRFFGALPVEIGPSCSDLQIYKSKNSDPVFGLNRAAFGNPVNYLVKTCGLTQVGKGLNGNVNVDSCVYSGNPPQLQPLLFLISSVPSRVIVNRPFTFRVRADYTTSQFRFDARIIQSPPNGVVSGEPIITLNDLYADITLTPLVADARQKYILEIKVIDPPYESQPLVVSFEAIDPSLGGTTLPAGTQPGTTSPQASPPVTIPPTIGIDPEIPVRLSAGQSYGPFTVRLNDFNERVRFTYGFSEKPTGGEINLLDIAQMGDRSANMQIHPTVAGSYRLVIRAQRATGSTGIVAQKDDIIFSVTPAISTTPQAQACRNSGEACSTSNPCCQGFTCNSLGVCADVPARAICDNDNRCEVGEGCNNCPTDCAVCSNDLECDDGNTQTQDRCESPDSCSATCSHTPPVAQPPAQPSVSQLSLDNFIELYLMRDVQRLGQFISDCGRQGDCVCRYSDWANNANPPLSNVLFTSMLDPSIDSSVKEEAVRRFSLKIEDLGGTGSVLLIPMLDDRNIETIEFVDVQNSAGLVEVRTGRKNRVRIVGINVAGTRYAGIEPFDNIIISPTADGGYVYSSNVLNSGETSCDTFAITWGALGLNRVKLFVKCRNNIQSPIPTNGGFCTGIQNNLPALLSGSSGGTSVLPPQPGGTTTAPTQSTGTATTPSCTITDLICRDGADNECDNTGNNEVDYNGILNSDGTIVKKGDSLCPVGVRSVSVEGGITQIEEGQPFTALCTASVVGVRSIGAAVYHYEGSNLVLEGYCNFDESRGWNGNAGPFNCNAGHYIDNRPKVVRCEVDTAKSYLTREEERYADAAIEVTESQQTQPVPAQPTEQTVTIQEQFGDFAPFVEDLAKINAFISECAASSEQNCLCRYDRWAEAGSLPTQVFSSVQSLPESIREDLSNRVLLSFTATDQGVQPGLVPDRTLTNQQVIDFIQNMPQLSEILYPNMIDMVPSGTPRIKVSVLFTRRLSTDIARTQETELIYIRPNPAGGYYSFVDNTGRTFLDEQSSRHCSTIYIYKRDEDVGTRHVREDKFLGCDGSGRTQDIAGDVCSLGNSYTGTLPTQTNQQGPVQGETGAQVQTPQSQYAPVVSVLQRDVNRLGQFFETCAASPRTDACSCSYNAFSHGQALFQTLNSPDVSEEIKQQLVSDFRISIEKTNNANTLSLIPRVSPTPQNQELASAIAQAFSQAVVVGGSEGFVSATQQINSLDITAQQITPSLIAVNTNQDSSFTISPDISSNFNLLDFQRNPAQCQDFLIFKDEQNRFKIGKCVGQNRNPQITVPSCFELQGPIGNTVAPPQVDLTCQQRNSECSIPNARPVCTLDTQTNTRSCSIQQCNAGFVDVNQNVQDGCECRRSFPTLLGIQPQSREETFGEGVCRDGIDNDCDGDIDGEDSGCLVNIEYRQIRNFDDLRGALSAINVDFDDDVIQDLVRRRVIRGVTFNLGNQRIVESRVTQRDSFGRETVSIFIDLNFPPSELQDIYNFFRDVPEAVQYVSVVRFVETQPGQLAFITEDEPQTIHLSTSEITAPVTLRHEFEHVMDIFIERKEFAIGNERPERRTEINLQTLYNQILADWLHSVLTDNRFEVVIRGVENIFISNVKQPLANLQTRLRELRNIPSHQRSPLQQEQLDFNEQVYGDFNSGLTIPRTHYQVNGVPTSITLPAYGCLWTDSPAQTDIMSRRGEFENRVGFLRNFNIFQPPGGTAVLSMEELLFNLGEYLALDYGLIVEYRLIRAREEIIRRNPRATQQELDLMLREIDNRPMLRSITFPRNAVNTFTDYFNNVFGFPESNFRVYGTYDSFHGDTLCFTARRRFRQPLRRTPAVAQATGDIATDVKFVELSSSYTEVPLNIKLARASSTGPAARKLNRALAQLAYDAGKMSREEYENIMSCNTNNDCGKCMLYKKTCIPEQS